jgi:hypothetical protein
LSLEERMKYSETKLYDFLRSYKSIFLILYLSYYRDWCKISETPMFCKIFTWLYMIIDDIEAISHTSIQESVTDPSILFPDLGYSLLYNATIQYFDVVFSYYHIRSDPFIWVLKIFLLPFDTILFLFIIISTK